MVRARAVLWNSGLALAASFCALACGHTTTQPRTVATGWRLLHISRDSRVLFIDYSYGCPYRPTRLTAAETASTVTVTVWLNQYLFGNYNCLAMLQSDISRVDLKAPLGKRTLIDGSDHKAPETEPRVCQLAPRELRDSMRRLRRPAHDFPALDRLNRFCRA